MGPPRHGETDAETPAKMGHVYTIHPNAGERFYIRLFLCHVPRVTLFESLRTLDTGIVFETFHEVCIRRLLQNDVEWHRCMDEVSHSLTSTKALCRRFDTLLRCGQVQSPRSVRKATMMNSLPITSTTNDEQTATNRWTIDQQPCAFGHRQHPSFPWFQRHILWPALTPTTYGANQHQPTPARNPG